MPEFRQLVDENLFFAHAQLKVFESDRTEKHAHPLSGLSFLQASVVQQVMALQAYLLEITDGAALHGGLALLDENTSAKQDFRLSELRELKRKNTWLAKLLHIHAQIQMSSGNQHAATNIIASSEQTVFTQSNEDWRTTSPEELRDCLGQFKAFIQRHRDMAQEY